MKFVLLFLLFLSTTHLITAQVVKIESGISYSTFDEKIGNNRYICPHNSYTFNVGIDYFEHHYFYISSKIGYIPISSYFYFYNLSGNIDEKIKFISHNLHLSTTIRGKLYFPFNSNNIFLFAGIGPKVEYVYKNDISPSELKVGIKTPDFKDMLGLKGEVGLSSDFKNIRVELVCSHSRNMMKTRKIKINTCCISIGYIF
jgi:outer membrane protein W